MPEPITDPLSVEKAIEESTSVFEGHPAEGEIDNNPGEESEKKVDEESIVKVDETPVEKVDDKKPAFEYVSQEAAEKGVKDTKTAMHQKADEAKKANERAEDLQRQLNEALLKVTATPAKEEPAQPTSADRMGKLLEQVEALDPDDEDYHLKVAEIWGQREDEMQGTLDTKVQQALDAYDKKVKEAKTKVDDELSTQKTILSEAEVAGKAAGLDMKKGSDDSEMFWAFADKAPDGTIETQIEWTVSKVKGIKDGIASPVIEEKDKILEAERKAKANQEKNTVLERGGIKPVSKAVPATPLGLADGFKQNQRRI